MELTYDRDRVTTPLVRTGGPGEFTATTWEHALDLCATRLSATRDTHGPESLGILRGNPPYFDSGGMLWGEGFNAALGISRTYTVNAEDAASRLTANEALYGDVARFPRPDLWHTDLALVLGANPLVARSTRLSEPQIREAFDAIVARGGRVLVVDPRRTVTAARYEHIDVRPGTDPWFLLGVCRLILTSDPDGLRSERGGPLSGRESFAALIEDLDPDDCAERCGVDPATMKQVAQAFVDAESATVYGATGACAQRFGTLTNVLLDTVVGLTGGIDRRGGLLGSWSPTDSGTSRPAPASGSRRSRAEGRPEVAGRLPSAALAADITHPGADRVRAVVIFGNNSVLSSGGGGQRLESALAQLDFSVGIDLYLNETNRFADVILPVTGMFERDDYPLATGGIQLRPTAYATRAVVPAVGDTRDSWWIFDEISRRMGLGGSCPDKQVEQAAEARGARPTPTEAIDALLSRGPVQGLTVEALVSGHPNGVALQVGLPVGRLTGGLPTPDGGVQLCSDQLRAEVSRLRAYVEPDDRWPLRLVGRRERGSQNTWMHNSSRLYPDDYRFRAHIHPLDAASCGVADGDLVRLTSAVGSIVVPVSIVDSVRAGVVSVPNGWGHAGGSWQRANDTGGVNVNVLIDSDDVEAIAGMSILNGVAIAMAPATGPDTP